MVKSHPKRVAVVDPASRRTKRAYNALSASSVGLELGISVIIALLFGMWLDRRFGTQPWLMLAFLVIGLIAGFRNVFRAIARVERAADDDDDDDDKHTGARRG